MSYRMVGQRWRAVGGLGQTKTGTTSGDHTAQDWGTALTTGGSLITGIVGAATGQPQAQPTTTPTTTDASAFTPAAASAAPGWYWPVIIGTGLVLVGGVAYVLTSAHKPVKANRRGRVSRNPKRGGRRVSRWALRMNPNDDEREQFVADDEYWYGRQQRSGRSARAFVRAHRAEIDASMGATVAGRRRAHDDPATGRYTRRVFSNRLSAATRAKIPLRYFVFPERRAFPLDTRKHAYDAMQALHLGRVKSASDYLAITNAIQKRYPGVWKQHRHMLSGPKTAAAKRKGLAARARRRTSRKAA